jgi:phosphate butyryltransferase
VPLRNFDDIVQVVKSRKEKKRFAIVAAESRLTLEPVLLAHTDGLIQPVLIGNRSAIVGYVEEIAGGLDGVEIISADTHEEAAQKAVDLVNAGEADCIMKGRIDTSLLMSTVLRGSSGLRTGTIVSALSIMQVPSYHKLLAHMDSAVLVSPDLNQKRQMIESAVVMLRKLGIDCPKVGVMAAVEAVNPKIPATIDARELKRMNERGDIRGCIIEGPISFDLAVSKEAALAKGFESPVAGDADLLIWPDINAGNLTGKALIHLAGAIPAALVIGMKVPVLVSSRSSPFKEKYVSMALAAL